MTKIHEGKSRIVPRVFVPLYGSEQPDPARQMSRGQAWPVKDAGKPTAANIEKFIVAYYKSTRPGGANAHIGAQSNGKGWPVQPPARAYVYDQIKGEIVGEWTAPKFWVIDESTVSIPQQILNSVEAATYYLRQSMALEEARKRSADFKRDDCTVNTWFERDRAHVSLECGDETVAEWWDDEVQDMADSGYFTMNKGDAALSRSVLDYAVEMGLISESVNAENGKTGGKVFNQTRNIGKSRYVVNHHDGVKTHKDGSPFFDISIFGNQRDNDAFVKDLRRKGYVEESTVSEATIRDVRAMVAKNNAEYGTEFSISGAYSNHELWAKSASGDDYRLEAGSVTDVYNAFVRERFKEKWRVNKAAPVGESERPFPYYKLDADEVLSSYIEAALWSSNDDDGTPLDTNYDRSDIAPSTIASMKRDVEKFVSVLKRAKDLDLDGWSNEQIGHDLWLSRNGHGAGFFDRDLPSADRLQKFAKAMREVDLYVGDDGKVRAMQESVSESVKTQAGAQRELQSHGIDIGTYRRLLKSLGSATPGSVLVLTVTEPDAEYTGRTGLGTSAEIKIVQADDSTELRGHSISRSVGSTSTRSWSGNSQTVTVLAVNEAINEGRDWDYERDGPGLLITAPDGRTCFLQGDEASELEDRLDAARTQRQINDILDAYDDVCEASKGESYTVHSKKPRKFDTLEAARKYADDYFKSTGIIVAVTPTKQKNESCDVDALLEAKRKAKGIYRTGENGVFFIPANKIDKGLVAKTDARMEKKYGKGFSKLSDAEKLRRIRGGMDKAAKSGDTAKHRDHLKDYDAVASTRGGSKAAKASRDRTDKARYGKRARWNESLDEGTVHPLVKNAPGGGFPTYDEWLKREHKVSRSGPDMNYQSVPGRAEGRGSWRLWPGTTSKQEVLQMEYAIQRQSAGHFTAQQRQEVIDFFMEPRRKAAHAKRNAKYGLDPDGYPLKENAMNSIASKAIAEARRKAGLPNKDVNEISTGARTAGFLMSNAPQREKDRIAPGGNSFVAPPGVSAVGERIDQFLDSVSEAEKLTKAELILMDRKRAKRERRGKGNATGKQRLASKRNAKKAQRALLRGSTQRKAAKTRMRRGKLRGN